jgi:hypothetical protein
MQDDIYTILGTVSIPEEKKEEFNGYVMQVLTKTGIRKIREITIAGKKAKVIELPAPDENGIVEFDYSIFEKRERNIATYNMNTCELDTPDRGYREFGLVMNVIMTMQEAYSDGHCYVMDENEPYNIKGTTALIKSLLGIDLEFPGRKRLWDMALFFHRNPGCKFDASAVYNSYPVDIDDIAIRNYNIVRDIENLEIDIPKERFCGEKCEIKCASPYLLRYYVYEVMNKLNGDQNDTDLEGFLKELLDGNLEKRQSMAKRDDAYGVLAELSLYLMVPRMVHAYAAVIGKPFWETWDLLGISGYTEIIYHRMIGMDTLKDDRITLPFYKTTFRENEDEFVEFWDEKDMFFSEKMWSCFRKWKQRFNEIKDSNNVSAETLLAEIVTEMSDEWGYRYVDYEFVKEFLEYQGDENYRKALILLHEILGKGTEYFPELTGQQAIHWMIANTLEPFDRIALSALQSLLTNHRHRMDIFGF